MKRLVSLLILFVAIATYGQRAKYVFYFIGDGMGVNQVNAAETYLGALEDRIGITPLCFPSFPYAGLVNTQSGTNGVTDSAAAGTALATGHKSHNGSLGVLTDQTTPVSSVAKWAQDCGAAVGVTTSVTVDHATPASFYAHVANRGQNWEIQQQMLATGYDFFAGSDFSTPDNPKKDELDYAPDMYAQAKEAGYTVVRGYKDYQKAAKKADKMILLQMGTGSMEDHYSIPYAIDREASDLTLTDITRAAINFLTKKQKEKDGFFLMVEGGKIDFAGHGNDIATNIHETIDMDNAIRVAYEFYQQHPDETLIVVTADHETGGLVLGTGAYDLRLGNLRYQKMSITKLGRELHKLHEKHGDNYNWDVVKAFVAENFGFWDKLQLTDRQNQRLETAFQHIMEGKGTDTKNLYSKDDEFATAVRLVMQELAMAHWGHGSHSNGYVPVFAVGQGAEKFTGRLDNTEIPKRIAQAAGWTIK